MNTAALAFESPSVAPYNKAFFSLYEDLFLILKAERGVGPALDLVRTIFRTNLGRGFAELASPSGDPADFVRIIGARDASVGLVVRFPELTEDRLVYQFLTDPFPNLKGHVDHASLDATYLEFKVAHFLGSGWSYRTTQHLWAGDPCTEHVIFRHGVNESEMPPRPSGIRWKHHPSS